MPLSLIQVLTNSAGEYHNPPRAKALRAATINDSQFNSENDKLMVIDI
jgi:hypothetical protein